MGCIISLFRYGTFWPPVVPHVVNRSRRADPDTIAATKIQAGFRGYKTRQELQKAAKSKLSDEEIARRLKPPLSTIKEEEEAAAVKIQAGVRGYLTRKRIKQSLDYSFDDGFGMGSVDGGELSGQATPEPRFEKPDVAVDIEVVPESVSPVLSVPEALPSAIIDEPAPVAELQSQEYIYEVEPPLEKPDAAVDIETVREPISAVLSIQEALPSAIIDEPAPFGELQSQENICEVEPQLEKPDVAVYIETVRQPISSVLSVQEALPSAAIDESVSATELQSQEDIYEIGMLDDIPLEEQETVVESLPHAELEQDILFIDTEAVVSPVITEVASETIAILKSTVESPAIAEVVPESKTIEISKSTVVSLAEVAPESETIEISKSTVVSPAIAEVVPESKAIEISKSAELGSLPLAQVGVNKLIGVFETGNPEPSTVSQAQELVKIPEHVSEASLALISESEAEPQISGSFSESTVIEATDPIPSEPADPPVQRRNSKRKMRAGTEKYRSGIVIEHAVDVGERMHIPSLEEIDAEIEAEMMNNAAAKIQAGYRGFQVRKGLNQAATRIQSNYRGYKTRKELKDKALAAVKIQATVRGFLARRRIHTIRYQQQRRKSSARRRSSVQNQLKSQALLKQSVVAATRIQAAYRGYVVRSKKRENEAPE